MNTKNVKNEHISFLPIYIYAMLSFDRILQELPANIYLFKFSNRNTRKRCEICSKLTVKHQNDVSDFKHISHLF